MAFPQYDFTYIQQAVNERTRSSVHIWITSKCEAISNILDITENLWWNKAMKKYLSWVTSWLSGTFNYQKTILTKLCFKLHWCFSSPEISVWKKKTQINSIREHSQSHPQIWKILFGTFWWFSVTKHLSLSSLFMGTVRDLVQLVSAFLLGPEQSCQDILLSVYWNIVGSPVFLLLLILVLLNNFKLSG